MSHRPDARKRRAALIAIVGSDGSGKSTVGAAVLETARTFGPAEAAHLGKQSGNVARAIARWPLFGSKLDRTIESQIRKTRGDRTDTNPKLLAAIVMHGFTLRRLRRYTRMKRLLDAGSTIVADRFPQMDVAGAYDGPTMLVDAPASPPVRWLARKERAAFAVMTARRPDLVIRLNVDLATALARKPDHKPDALARKIAATPRLVFAGAPIVDIDSRRPLDEVVAEARRAVIDLLSRPAGI